MMNFGLTWIWECVFAICDLYVIVFVPLTSKVGKGPLVIRLFIGVFVVLSVHDSVPPTY